MSVCVTEREREGKREIKKKVRRRDGSTGDKEEMEKAGTKKGKNVLEKASGRTALLGSSTTECQNRRNLRSPPDPAPSCRAQKRSKKSGSRRDTKLSLDSGSLSRSGSLSFGNRAFFSNSRNTLCTGLDHPYA